jgi:hypothetical protein
MGGILQATDYQVSCGQFIAICGAGPAPPHLWDFREITEMS